MQPIRTEAKASGLTIEHTNPLERKNEEKEIQPVEMRLSRPREMRATEGSALLGEKEFAFLLFSF